MMRMGKVYDAAKPSILREIPMRTRLLCMMLVSLSPATMAAGQATPAALPGDLRPHVQNGRLDMISSIRGLPLGVRNELQMLFGTPTLDIAEPGAASQSLRRLVAAGCSYEDCLVYYERGSGSARAWRVMLLHWTPNATKFEWGGSAPGGLATIDAVRSAVLAGTIKTSTGPW
jgi:hypothetical protein